MTDMSDIYDWSETDEIAANLPDTTNIKTWEEARAYVRGMWPDEGEQLRDNMAESILARNGAL